MRIVLAYSGGLDTSVALHWLRERHDAEVVAYCADLGQPGSLADVRAHARCERRGRGRRRRPARGLPARLRAARAARQRRARAPLPDGRAAGTPADRQAARRGRARRAARTPSRTARPERAPTASASTPRSSRTTRRCGCSAPAAEWELTSRADELAYAARHGIEVAGRPRQPVQHRRQRLGDEHRVRPGRGPGRTAARRRLADHRSVATAPDDPADVVVGFARGVPVALDGRELPPLELVRTLGELGGIHGVGRADVVESSLLGIKTRALYECPAGAILHAAHRELEFAVPRSRHAPLQGGRRPALRRARLRRPVVLAAAPLARRVRRRHAGDARRDGGVASAQGDNRLPRAQLAVRAPPTRRSPTTTPATASTTAPPPASPTCGRSGRGSTQTSSRLDRRRSARGR